MFEGGKGVHTFPKGIIQKVNVIARLEFEPNNYEVAVWHVSNYVTGTTLIKWSTKKSLGNQYATGIAVKFSYG